MSHPVLFGLCPTKPLRLLILSHYITKLGFGDWMREVHPQNGFILFNAAQKCRYGAFKSMWEGQIDLSGHCPFLSTQATVTQQWLHPLHLNSLICPTISAPPIHQCPWSQLYVYHRMIKWKFGCWFPLHSVGRCTASRHLWLHCRILSKSQQCHMPCDHPAVSICHIGACDDEHSWHATQAKGGIPCWGAHMAVRWALEEVH